MGRRKLKVYYIHNIDGRNCGMIAAFNKASVSRAFRLSQSEIVEAIHNPAGQALAMETPGRLLIQPIDTRHPSLWSRSNREYIDVSENAP